LTDYGNSNIIIAGRARFRRLCLTFSLAAMNGEPEAKRTIKLWKLLVFIAIASIVLAWVLHKR
jgi:hypothetical protein